MKIRISVAVVAAALVLAGCSAGTSPTSGWSGDAVTGAPAAPECRGSADDPRPGDVICYRDDLDDPLEITVGGTPGAPIIYSGTGETTVPGIRAEADNIIIQGFVSAARKTPASGRPARTSPFRTTRSPRSSTPQNDLDAIRFFGDGARVLHNYAYDVEGTSDIGDSHVDCMQTFATSGPGSSNVVIQGNRCEGIRAQCLMAEGPHDEDGSRKGVSRNWLFEGNYCDAYAAAQSVSRAEHPGRHDHPQRDGRQGQQGVRAGQGGHRGHRGQDNTIGPDYGRAVGFDDPSAQEGYNGPEAY